MISATQKEESDDSQFVHQMDLVLEILESVKVKEEFKVKDFFYCCTVHFDNTEILITNKCTSLLHIQNAKIYS